MLLGEKSICLGCMTEKDYDGPCEKCGYQEDGPFDINYLSPGTILCERYLVGKLLHCNGESATYIGYDLQEDFKVCIRELMPYDLVTRNHSNMELKPLRDKETQYKGLVAEFEELARILQNLSNTRGVIPALDIFRENSTVYVVYRFINTIPLSELLTRCGGDIKWGKCKKMFLQLLNAVSLVHKKGLIHAGISPQTVLVDDKGTAYLSEFSINALRASDSGITCELFAGYSAPEQYENKSWYGEWTDVYSLCAILYRTITGTMPPDAPSRLAQDNLMAAQLLDSSVPQNVSDAIQSGMALSVEARTQSVDALAAQLLDSVESNTAVYRADMVEDIHKRMRTLAPAAADAVFAEDGGGAAGLDKKAEKRQLRAQKKAQIAQLRLEKKEARKRTKKHGFLAIFLSMLLTVAALGAFLMIFISQKYDDIQKSVSNYMSQSSSAASGSETSSTGAAGDMSLVPSFVGQYLDTINANSDYNARFDFEVTYERSDKYSAGVVCSQSPQAETPIVDKRTVLLTVSKGPKTVKLPPLAGSTLELATKTLDDLEIKYNIFYVTNEEYTQGLVAYTEPAAESTINLDEEEVSIFTKKSLADAPPSSSKPSESSTSSSSGPKAKKVIRDDDEPYGK